MRLLIDTHLLVWWLAGGVRLPRRARGFLADTSNQVSFNAASVWEISVKAALGKIEADPNEMLVALRSGGFEELPVAGRHASVVMRLPAHYRDPFDRTPRRAEHGGVARSVDG